jgi:aspartate kinase
LRDRFPQLEIHLADARDIIATDSTFGGARALPEKIAKNIKEKWGSVLRKEHTLIVTQGFIGSDEHKRTTILGREGSDYTATLLGEAISASEVHIWTDVPGVAIADPKLFPNAPFIDSLCFEQAATMAQLGSKVLFSNTLAPSIRTGTPVMVGQTAHPEKGGTWIGKDTEQEWPMTLAMMESIKMLPVRFPSLAKDLIVISIVGGEQVERVLVSKALEQIPSCQMIENGKHHLSIAIPAFAKGRAVVALLPFFDRATRLA